MTPAQQKLYWREWLAAKRAARLEEADRHALHEQTLGTPKSSKDLTNQDLDKILATFRALSHPGDLNSQLRQQNQPRTRLLFAIRHQIKLLGVLVDDPHAYVTAILRDRFHETDIESLRHSLEHEDPDGTSVAGDTPLDQMRFTITRAVLRLRQRAGLTPAELETLADEGQTHARPDLAPINLNREVALP